MNNFFSADELAQLRAHGIVIFAERVIFDAQPPMPPGEIAAVQAQCAGPLPEPLLALWRETAGGALDYELHLRMNGAQEAISWNELFWNGSNAYHDLQGWIEHERESAEEAAAARGESWNGKLAVLPFGGFEYCDRIYAVVEPGAEHGHILAWKQGLPPAWTHAMHEDGVATLATGLLGAFAALHLSEDPLAPGGDYFTGQALLDYIDERHGDHGLDLELADKLVAFYRRALIDWRGPLAEGTLARTPDLAQAALRHAIATDDAALMAELAAAGVALDAPLQGTALPTDLALVQGAHATAQALLDAGAPVHPDALDGIEGAISPELVTTLLARGVQPSATAVAQCVAGGAPDAARRIAEAYAQAHDDLPAAFDAARNALLARIEAQVEEIRREKLEHPLGIEALLTQAEHLQSFAL